MSKQRMRYRWWTDVPRNVSRQEYSRLQLFNMGAILTGFLAVGSALLALTGGSLQESKELAQLEAMSIAEAANYQGDSVELVKLEGFLVSDEVARMPDDESLTVIRGNVELIIQALTDSDVRLQDTLFEWTYKAESIFLSDGDAQIPLAFDLAKIPVPAAEVDWDMEPEIEKAAGSARNRKPTAVIYGDMTFPLDAETWGSAGDDVRVEMTRTALPHGQSAVVVAGLEATDVGNRLVDPLGDRLTVKLGTEADILADNQQTRRMFAFLWIPFAIACFFLSRSARRYYQELVEISNQE